MSGGWGVGYVRMGVPAAPVTYTILGDLSDACVYGSSTSYASVVAGGVETLESASSGVGVIGQFPDNSGAFPVYYNYEYFVSFDTSVVVGTITSATLSIWCSSDSSAVDFIVEARPYNWGAAVDTGDYRPSASLGGLTLLASKDTATGWSGGGYNDLTSTAAFLTAINQSGTTHLVLSSSRYRTATAPTNFEFVQIALADTGGTSFDPKLVIVAA